MLFQMLQSLAGNGQKEGRSKTKTEDKGKHGGKEEDIETAGSTGPEDVCRTDGGEYWKTVSARESSWCRPGLQGIEVIVMHCRRRILIDKGCSPPATCCLFLSTSFPYRATHLANLPDPVTVDMRACTKKPQSYKSLAQIPHGHPCSESIQGFITKYLAAYGYQKPLGCVPKELIYSAKQTTAQTSISGRSTFRLFHQHHQHPYIKCVVQSFRTAL